MTAPTPIQRLLEIMARLRDPERGCPWDVEQNFSTIAPYTIEEAYEVADAIARNDMADLKEELGDLLLQSVFHAQMAKEQGLFDFDDVATAIADKLVRRHPHVFEDKNYGSIEEQKAAWEAMKAEERAAKGKAAKVPSVLDDIPQALPALARGQKIHARATKADFDWENTEELMGKLEEELAELRAAIASGDKANQAEELGDVLFCMGGLAHKLGADAEDSLRGANHKFTTRFQYIEAQLQAAGKGFDEVPRAQLEQWWREAKQREKNPA